jgi:purine nucleoside phosphorylase
MIAVIGGTGLGEALFGQAAGQEHIIDTPFGRPSGCRSPCSPGTATATC